MNKILIVLVCLNLIICLVAANGVVADSGARPATQSTTKPVIVISRHGPDGEYTLDIMQDRYDVGEYVRAKLVYRNSTPEIQFLPHRDEIYWLCFFDVTRDGQSVTLTAWGLHEKQSKPHTGLLLDHGPLLIRPNSELIVEFDLNRYFDITLEGDYKLTPKVTVDGDKKRWELSEPIIFKIRNMYDRERIQSKVGSK